VTPLGALGSRLEERLRSRSATVGVVGLGYVGLPLAVAFARAGFRVVGVDADPSRAA
jgi:UDP-N-acetyl-D-glucosamine dehydrogenase